MLFVPSTSEGHLRLVPWMWPVSMVFSYVATFFVANIGRLIHTFSCFSTRIFISGGHLDHALEWYVRRDHFLLRVRFQIILKFLVLLQNPYLVKVWSERGLSHWMWT